MRQQKCGRIINKSSILGLIPSPFNAYGMQGRAIHSKHGGNFTQIGTAMALLVSGIAA